MRHRCAFGSQVAALLGWGMPRDCCPAHAHRPGPLLACLPPRQPPSSALRPPLRAPRDMNPKAGHSLGGALAVLASLDIARQLPRSQLTVYTYGAPRVRGMRLSWQAGELAGRHIDAQPGGPRNPPTELLSVFRLPTNSLQVGNSAFAAEQDEAVPDTWAILVRAPHGWGVGSCGSCRRSNCRLR